jgi:hypothetical protein
MAKYQAARRDLKTIRETELLVSRRFNRNLESVEIDTLSNEVYTHAYKLSKGKYRTVYFAFRFNIDTIDTDGLDIGIQRYLLELLQQRFKGRLDDIQSGEGEIKNWFVFTSTFKATPRLIHFTAEFPQFIQTNLVDKFSQEGEPVITLTGIQVIFKRRRGIKRKGRGKQLKRKRVIFEVFTVKGRRLKRVNNAKSLRAIKPAKRKPIKKRGHLRHRNHRRRK